MRLRSICLSIILLTSAAVFAEEPIAKRILIVSIDGLRPDLLVRANTPTIKGLLPQSTFTFWARTIPHAITTPAHVSMLTGVVPRKHEVEWNKDLPLSKPVYPLFPTLFEVAHAAGYSTAMAAGKSKFDVLAKPGTVDWMWLPETEKCEDAEVASRACAMIREHQPQVLVVHLPTVDNVGHKVGWGSDEQLNALAGADRALEELLAALQAVGVRDSTVILITSDHGGAGLTHLAGDLRAEFIPWIISGPGIRRNLDLTIYPNTNVQTMDTFATACRILGVPRSAKLDGRPIIEALQNAGELLKNE